MNRKISLLLYLEPEKLEKIKKYCSETGIPVAVIIRRAIDSFFDGYMAKKEKT